MRGWPHVMLGVRPFPFYGAPVTSSQNLYNAQITILFSPCGHTRPAWRNIMRILHTADWHLGRRLEGRSRHEEQEKVLDEICRIVDDEAIDAVIVAGDVFDAYNPPAESEALFYRTMTRLSDGGRRAVVVIAGNHDSPDRLIASDPYARALGITTIGYPKDVPALYDAGSSRVACIESSPSFIRLRLPESGELLNVLALPYPSESRLRELLTAEVENEEQASLNYNHRVRAFLDDCGRRFNPGQVNIIASHLFVAGGEECESERQIQVGGLYTIDPASFPPSAGYVALGHLHRAQTMQGREGVPVRYSGSILQYSFSEAEQQKSVTILEWNGADLTHTALPLSEGRTLRRWMIEGGLPELEHRLAETGREDLLSITVTLSDPPAPDYMSNLRRSHPGIVICNSRYRQLVDESGESLPELESLPLDEQFRRFVAERFNEPCSSEVLKLFLELAAAGDESL